MKNFERKVISANGSTITVGVWYRFKIEYIDGVVEYSVASFNDYTYAISSAMMTSLHKKKEVAIITIVKA